MPAVAKGPQEFNVYWSRLPHEVLQEHWSLMFPDPQDNQTHQVFSGPDNANDANDSLD